MENPPIFVRGMSRSGGTLMVTILDSHPNVAMSYELYPRQLDLAGEGGNPELLRGIARNLQDDSDRKSALNSLPTTPFRNFVARCPRGGISHQRFGEILEEHADSGLLLDTTDGQMRLMERCCQEKMHNEGKAIWGLKCDNRYDEYSGLWPGSRFLNMLRDGRDVLASQLNTGSFNPDPFECGRSWAQTHKIFADFVEKNPSRGYFVKYEDLCESPESQLLSIFEFLELEFEPSLLQFHNKDLTIFGTNHLSKDRISKPVDTTSIGRWRDEVSQEQLEQFYGSAGESMERYGYL